MDPAATVRAFGVAISEERFEDAYRLTSTAYRQRVSLEEFRSHLQQNDEERRELAGALTRVAGPAEQTAIIYYDEGRELQLRREGERWLVADNVVDFYDQSTPRAALRTFIRALERKRYDVMLRLIPEADKHGITVERMRQAWEEEQPEEMQRLLSNLRQHIDNPIERVGDHATMPYGDRAAVQLLREEGVWKIEDPE